MSLFAISFRIHEDSTYETRYESLVEQIQKEAVDNTWEETTSFYLIESEQKTSKSLCDDLYNNSKIIDSKDTKRWSHFVTQPAKVDSPMQRMIHHEDAETVFG